MIDTSLRRYYNDDDKQRRNAKMRMSKESDDMQIMIAKLSDENKKNVIAAAQALLFTQKGQKSEQNQSDNMVRLMTGER